MIIYYLLGRNSELPVRECNSFWESFNHHPPAVALIKTYLGEILNIRSENAILLGKVWLSGRRIEIWLPDARRFLVGLLRWTLVETIILCPQDGIRPTLEKFSTSSWRIQLFVGKFQYPSWRLICGLDGLTSSGQRMLCSFESSNLRPENWDLTSRSSKVSIRRTEFNAGRNYHLPAGRFNTTSLGEILKLRSGNSILIVKVSTFRAE